MRDDDPAPVVRGSRLDADVESARRWMAELGFALNRRADTHNAAIDVCLDKVCLIAVCMNLPGDWPLRVRLFSGGRAFELYA